MRKAHAAQDLGRLGELQVAIFDDLDAVSPGIEKVHEISLQHRRPGRLRKLAHAAAVIDDEPEMALFVALLPLSLHQRDKLIAHIDEGATGTAPPQLEVENPAIEGERLLDI